MIYDRQIKSNRNGIKCLANNWYDNYVFGDIENDSIFM